MPIKRDGSRKRLYARVDKTTEFQLKFLAEAAGLTVRHNKKDIGSIGLLLDKIASFDGFRNSKLLGLIKQQEKKYAQQPNPPDNAPIGEPVLGWYGGSDFATVTREYDSDPSGAEVWLWRGMNGQLVDSPDGWLDLPEVHE
ncbi:hypothetical protein [Adonisia turfae]|nr:hypothetical protein [Adonisia turfae]